MAVVENLPSPATERPIGFGRLKRKEDARFIRGQGRDLDDIKLPGMVYGALLRSPSAHARILSIDTEVHEELGEQAINRVFIVEPMAD